MSRYVWKEPNRILGDSISWRNRERRTNETVWESRKDNPNGVRKPGKIVVRSQGKRI
jgi:hypothetical protein